MLYIESRKSFKVRREKIKLFAECHRFTLGKHINGWTSGTLFAKCLPLLSFFFLFCRVFMHIFAKYFY